MIYKVTWKGKAEKYLAKIDKSMAKKIRDKVENYLVGDPINRGEPLYYGWEGHYRYRFSDYRIIYKIKENELIILIVKVGHRKEVY